MNPSGSWQVYSGKSIRSPDRAGNHVLLHPLKPRWLVVNDTALRIAQHLGQGSSIEEIAAGLASLHGIPLESARVDVAEVSERLHQEGFLGAVVSSASERSPSVRSLFIHTTSRCNLACSHCYALLPRMAGSAPAELATDVILRLIDELADLGGRSVALSGGEALLHPGIRTILGRAVARNLDVRLLTNGTLLDREWVSFLVDLPVSVQVSIDGSRSEIHDAIRGQGSFEKALRAVELLLEAGMGKRTHLCATVMQDNAKDLPEIILLAERLGVPLVRFLPLRRKGRAEETWDAIGKNLEVADAEAFYRLVADRQGGSTTAVSCGLSGHMLKVPRETFEDEIWCPLGRKVDIDTNGDAYPCVLLMDESFKLGNVHQVSLASMVGSERMRETCCSLVGRRTTIERCASCLWRNLCQAGCMGQALDNTGTIWDVDDFCSYRQQAYAEAFDKILALEAAESR